MAGDAAHIAPCTGCLEGCVGHIFTPDPNVKVTTNSMVKEHHFFQGCDRHKYEKETVKNGMNHV